MINEDMLAKHYRNCGVCESKLPNCKCVATMTGKIRWLLKATNYSVDEIVLSEGEFLLLEDQWQSSISRRGDCSFEGIKIISRYFKDIEEKANELVMKDNSTKNSNQFTLEPETSDQQLGGAEMQVMTPGQVLDWLKGLSHQALKVDYLISDSGERIDVSELTPDIIYDCKYFIAGEQEVSVTPSEIANLMNLAYNCGEDRVDRDKMKLVIQNSLESLGFVNFKLPEVNV